MSARRLLNSISLAAAVTAFLGCSTALSSQGTLTFRATVTGKGNDSGSIRRPEAGSTLGGLVGCGVVKHKVPTPFGQYTYVVRTGAGTTIAGQKPLHPNVLLVVYRYKPASTSSYTHLDVSGAFSFKGRVYAGHPNSASKEAVKISTDGRSGTWVEPDGFRNYPAKMLKPLTGFAFKASWHCSTVRQFHD
jgi:hypothetical protein